MFGRGVPTPVPSQVPTPVPTVHAAIIVPDSAAIGVVLTNFISTSDFARTPPVAFAYGSSSSSNLNLATSINQVLVSTDDVSGYSSGGAESGSGDDPPAGWATFKLVNAVPIFTYRAADISMLQDICPDKDVQRSLNCLGPDNRLVSFTCPSPGTISYACGAHTFLPVCLVYEALQGGFARAPTTQCQVIGFDAYTTTCKCRMDPASSTAHAGGALSSQLLFVASAGVYDYKPLHVSFVSSVHTAFPTPAPSRILRIELVLDFRGVEASSVSSSMVIAIRQAVALMLGLDIARVGTPVIIERLAPTPQPSVLPSPKPSGIPTAAPTPRPSMAAPTGQPSSSPSLAGADLRRRRLTTANGFSAQVVLSIPNVYSIASITQLSSTLTTNSTALIRAVQAHCGAVDCSGLSVAVRAADLTPSAVPTPAPAPPSLPPALPQGLPAPEFGVSELFLGLCLGLGAGLPALALVLYCFHRSRLRRLKVFTADFSSVAPSSDVKFVNGGARKVAPAPRTEWQQRQSHRPWDQQSTLSGKGDRGESKVERLTF